MSNKIEDRLFKILSEMDSGIFYRKPVGFMSIFKSPEGYYNLLRENGNIVLWWHNNPFHHDYMMGTGLPFWLELGHGELLEYGETTFVRSTYVYSKKYKKCKDGYKLGCEKCEEIVYMFDNEEIGLLDA